jgi:hypothetical protein
VKNIFNQLFRKKGNKMDKENELQGGLADGKTIEAIALKHNVPVDELKLELQKGVAVEKEHTTDENTATEIAMDHLVENPKYYEALKKVEETPPVKPEEPKISMEQMIATAVALAMKAMEETKKQELETAKAEAQQKADVEIEKARKQAEQLQAENAELRRTQPTGIPDLQGQFGSVEKNAVEKAHEIAEGYRRGYGLNRK